MYNTDDGPCRVCNLLAGQLCCWSEAAGKPQYHWQHLCTSRRLSGQVMHWPASQQLQEGAPLATCFPSLLRACSARVAREESREPVALLGFPESFELLTAEQRASFAVLPLLSFEAESAATSRALNSTGLAKQWAMRTGVLFRPER